LWIQDIGRIHILNVRMRACKMFQITNYHKLSTDRYNIIFFQLQYICVGQVKFSWSGTFGKKAFIAPTKYCRTLECANTPRIQIKIKVYNC